MPKMKTHSGAKKRFKLTGTKKLRRLQQHNQHGFNKKTADQKARLSGETDVSKADVPRVMRMLGMK